MNNVEYAIPGLMPPAANNWSKKIYTNEDGSIKLCVHCGESTDKVYYALNVPGWDFGFIKDPQYFIDKDYPEEVIAKVQEYAQYMTSTDTLPSDAVVPKITINGWPIPITENNITNKYYWILELPKFVLPIGDTIVSIDANGKVTKYFITRPDFDIHYENDITPKS